MKNSSINNSLRVCNSGHSLTHATLFSGIGGPELAAQWLGWDNIFHCEINPFGRKILDHYWPESKSYEDITETDFTIWKHRIDVLTGGFPCQPYSQAGKRLGKEDDRHLWPEMLRAIREIQPTYIVGENVLGLTNWNEGLVFEEVQAELETEGYEVQSYVLPAAGVGAPHQRYRVFIVAYSSGARAGMEAHRTSGQEWRNPEASQPKVLSSRDGASDAKGTAKFDIYESLANANDKRLEGGKIKRGSGELRQIRDEQSAGFIRTNWQKFPTQSPVCNGDDGLPPELDGITISTWRKESLKAGGNAIVPQVIHQIYRAIDVHLKSGSEEKGIINTALPTQCQE